MSSSYIIIIISIIFSAFFSGMEIAFIASNKLRIELDKKHGGISPKIISLFTRNPSMYINTMLVGNNTVLVLYGTFMAKILEPFIINTFNINPESYILLLLLQTIISTLLILFVAEFIPKVVFRLNANSFLSAFSVPVMLFYVILYPVTLFVTKISNFVLHRIFKAEITSFERKRIFNIIDVNSLLDERLNKSDEKENIDPEIKIFQNALGFSKVKLRDCLIPRPEICAVDIESPIEELKLKFIETGYSKIIVFKEHIDNVIGYVNSKEIFKNPKKIGDIIIKIPFYPETMPANKLLEEFIQKKTGVAIVVDEFGGTEGMVTIEDIIEEIFGEIEDEHDIAEFIEKKLNDTTYIFAGRLEIDYLNEKYNLNLPTSDEYETISGLVLFHNENIPKVNDTISLENLHFKILKATNTRLELVRLEII